MGTTYKTGEELQFLFQDFFGVYNSMEHATLENIFESDNSGNITDYLKKGERMETLARTIYQRKISNISLTDAEKKIFAISIDPKMTYYDVVHRISKAFTRPCLRSMEKPNDKYASALLDAIELPGLKMELSFAENMDQIRRYLRKAVSTQKTPSTKTDNVVCVKFEEAGYPAMHLYGYKNTTHTQKNLAVYVAPECIRIVDLADFFSSLIIYAQVMKKISDYLAVRASEREQNITFSSMEKKLEQFISHVLRCQCIKICPDAVILDSLEDIYHYPLHIEATAFSEEDTLLKYLKEKGVVINRQSISCHRWPKELEENSPSVGIRNAGAFAACFLLTCKDVLAYHRFLNGNSSIGPFYWGLPVGYRWPDSNKIYDTELMELLKGLFFIVAEEKTEQTKTLGYYESLTGEHAKSYQLKRAIPKRVLNAMKQSLFNKYFGFVEFDDETDIAKAEEIAKEFMALKETYLKDIDSSENAIRFRKLGNHKALGLYYPSVKCLCVDIRSPESLVHEYGHLIDYTNGSLSEKKDFREIKQHYVQYLHAQMEKNKTAKSLMEGKTKYNFDYYSRPTEIFARCFELYIGKVLGVRNSIVPITFSDMIYPQEENFLLTIAEYFNTMFGTSSEKHELTGTVKQLISCPSSDGNFVSH